MAGYTEFQALYDQYKILRVKMEFIPKVTAPELGSAAHASNFWTIIDYDDQASPVSLDELMQRSGLKRTKCTSKQTRILRPMVAKPIYKDGLTNAYGPGRAWIDAGNPDVPHYGLKWVLEKADVAASMMSYDCQVTYWVAFKNVR